MTDKTTPDEHYWWQHTATGKTYFPIKIVRLDNNTMMICNIPSETPRGVAFKVLATNVVTVEGL